MNYLYAALTATWIIHVLYLISLTRGYARVQQETKELHDRK